MVDLGRVDIRLEATIVSSHLAIPQEGHQEQVIHILTHISKYHNSDVIFDPSDHMVDESEFTRQDWTTSEF